ncbi:tyrosine-protein phosphatase [Streptomyces carpinensis]|uniref:Tyrosine-protein phosphatase n=1 Tax=Streptomyces carpinensis TaxID=66369 RepID=A0ABV1VX89_9ACTN|nr:tyrosine-protein phosphatase [Streptomyces carpinensis]
MTNMEITLSRRLPVEGTYNLRELGGLRAGERTVRWGKFYRSDALAGLTPTGKKSMDDLGIRLLIDLRTEEETTTEPTRLPAATIVHAPIFDSGMPTVMPEQPHTLDHVYDAMLDLHGARLTEAVRHIAHSGEERVLVHCTAGKDRTGLVVALALLAVGVHREDVVLDYSRTEQHLAGPWVEGMLAKMTAAGYPLDDDVLKLVSASPASLLERIVDRWENEWGSPLGFLQDHGFTTADHAALSAALLA